MGKKESSTVLILGGDGFIGSHLRDAHLNRGDKVISIDKANIRKVKYRRYLFSVHREITTSNAYDIIKNWAPYNFDIAYNCIAIATPDYYIKFPIETFELDFELNYVILKALHQYNIPYMHFSTCEVYGKYQLSDKYSEIDSPLIMGPSHKIRWIYATSKILLEQLILSHHQRGDCKAVIVRPFNFMGHDIDWIPCIDGTQEWSPRVYSCFLSALLSNNYMKIVKPGTQKRCYCYIDDAIEAIISIFDNFEKCNGKVINIGNPENETSIKNLSFFMKDIYNGLVMNNKAYTSSKIMISGKEFYGEGYDDSEQRVPDISLIKDLTGWEPKTNLFDTIKKSMVKSIKMFT